MNIKEYYNKWLESEYKSGSIGPVSAASLAPLRSNKWWRFLMSMLGYRVKSVIKSLAGFRILFGCPVGADEKKVAISYLDYIFSHNPEIDPHSFVEGSMEVITHILNSQFLFAHESRIPWSKLYPGEKLGEFYDAHKMHQKMIKIHGNTYTYKNFKTIFPSFEHSVLANNCSMDHVPKEVVEKLKGTIFVDCGAFIGDSAFVLRQFQPSLIAALEPDKKNFDILIQNIKLNGMQNVTPLKYGVGDKEGSLKFSSEGISSRITSEGNSEILITRIDDLKNTLPALGKIGLIKMDIEGHEQSALRGAEATIKENSPVLLIAIYHSGQDFFEIPQIIKQLNPKYKIKIVNASILTPLYEKYLVAYI
ncbi:MAG: FkbM family methyltransferase [Patescibacteria group bacterium]